MANLQCQQIQIFDLPIESKEWMRVSAYQRCAIHDANLDAVNRGAPNNSKNWQWTTEDDVTRDDRHLLRIAVNDRTVFSRQFGSMLVYCYRCTNVVFVNSSTSVAQWIACKGTFIQDPPHGKPSTAASTMG
ncbi:hypothetical protein TNCV_2089021 [Trichonephila clavipes]|nr:hypothetical protein TNCV_2089021 [Trichonephila clavipes]